MTWLEGTAIELMLLGLIWAGGSYCTRHIRGFFALRLRIRRQLQRMADDSLPELPPGGDLAHAGAASPPEPGDMCRKLGYEMLLFADKAPFSARLAKLMRFDPVRAGDDLISLAYDGRLGVRCRSIATALRLNDDEDLPPADGVY
jgi:hypothetical protein